MNLINPLHKKNIAHDMALYALGLWIVLNTAYEFLEGYTRLSSMSMMIFLATGALWLLIKGRYTVIGNYFFISMIIMEILILASIFYVPAEIMPIVTMYTKRFTSNVILIFIIINLIENKEDMEFVFKAFVLGGVLLAVMFYSIYGEDVLKLVERYSRVGNDFGNLNITAQRCAFSVVFCFYYMIYDKVKWHKVLYLLAFALCFSVALLSGSKKAVILIIIEIMYLIYSKTSKKDSKGKIKSVLIGLGVILVIFYVIMNIPIFSGIRDRFDEMFNYFFNQSYGSVSERNRVKYIRKGLEQFQLSPVWGKGMCYSYYMFGAYTHNNYVELLLNFGLLGFVTYYYTYGRILKDILKEKKHGNILNKLFVCILIALIINDFGVVSYYDRYSMILLCIMSTYFCMISPKIKSDRKEEDNG